MGYAYGPKMVQRWVAENRTRPASRTARKWLRDVCATAAPRSASSAKLVPTPAPAGPALPSPKQLAWLLVRPVEALSPADTAAAHRVEQDKEAALVAAFARRFTALIRNAAPRSRAGPPRPWPNWMLGWSRQRRAASEPLRRSPPGWKEMAPQSGPP